MEVKSVKLGWYEKSNTYENELLYAEELLAVDKDLAECDNILSEVGLQTGYCRYEKQIYEIAEKRQHLWNFIVALPEYMGIHLDEPLRKKLNHGACETISRIHMADFQVENTLGIQVQMDTRGYADITFGKDKLTLKDFLGNAVGEYANTCIPNQSGRTRDCVEEFAVIFQQQYDNMLAMGMLGDAPQKLEDYLGQFVALGECNHKEDQPFYKALLTNILDLTIIKPLIESCCGYDLITGEDLSEMERNMKVVGALVDMVTLATGIYGFTATAKSMGWKKAASYFGQLALVELASDVSAVTVATIGEYCDWPMGVTLLLSLGTGLTVGQVGNHLIFERNGIEIFRKEVSESGGFLEGKYSVLGEMSDADGIKYSNWMKVREGELYTDYVQAGSELSIKLESEGYKILKVEDATIANADWYDLGFDKPPIAENTVAYTVEAGNYSYSRVYLEGYNNPMSTFIVRSDEIAGLSAKEIAEKLALPKIPNKVVEVELPPSTPLEVSIVGPQPDWGTVGGDVQFAIKGVELNPQWFTNIRDLE